MGLNVFWYLKPVQKKKDLFDFVLKQKTKSDEVSWNVVSDPLREELEEYLSDVDVDVELPTELYINLNREGISIIGEAKTDEGDEVYEFFCDYAGNVLEYQTGF